MRKLLIDCDTGIDDSLALLFALKRRDVQVVGVTTGFGNIDAEQAAENTIRLIRLSGVSDPVPVAIGARKPLAGPWEGPTAHVHGANGIGNAVLPPSDQKPLEEDGCDFLVRMARTYPGELTVVTLGRLTNLALALEKEPALPRLIRRVVTMGGAVHVPGNVTPVSEANIAGDPEAADMVFAAGFDLTLVGLDVTMKTCLTPGDLDFLARHCAPENRPVAAYLQEAMAFYFDFYRTSGHMRDRCPVHDPLAVLVAVDPSVVTLRKLRARVECGGTWCRGMVVTAQSRRALDAPWISVCVDVDSRRAVDELLAPFLAGA